MPFRGMPVCPQSFSLFFCRQIFLSLGRGDPQGVGFRASELGLPRILCRRMTVAVPRTQTLPLARAVTTLHGVGPERAAQLARLEVHTIEDLLLLRPRRHEDRRHLRKIGELELQQPAITHGKVAALGVKWFSRHSKSIFELILDDGTAPLHCRWWNLPYMEKYFAVGDEVLVFGKPLGLKLRTMDHPETEVLEGGEETFIHL